jgi:uncharacterized membrane protein
LADEAQTKHDSPSEAVPRLRIQNLADLIFGLALSIGALTLLSGKQSSLFDIAVSVFAFGFAFFILASVWVRYTRIMSVLPIETGRLLLVNIILLFLVSIEPYLFNLILGSAVPSSETTSIYAIDMGGIFLILAFFFHALSQEGKKLIAGNLLRSYRLQRNASVATSVLFLSSLLPVFWTVTFFGVPVRFILWGGTFATRFVRIGFERRKS